MVKENIIQERSYKFAIHIVQFCKMLVRKKEYMFSRQLLKSGTSIGANVQEAQQAQSKPDFISKLSIALKEAYETRYWLKLLTDSKIVMPEETKGLLEEINQIIALLVAIMKTSKNVLK